MIRQTLPSPPYGGLRGQCGGQGKRTRARGAARGGDTRGSGWVRAVGLRGSAPGPKREANASRRRRVMMTRGSGWVRAVGVSGARPPGEMREAQASEREQGTPCGDEQRIRLGTHGRGSGGSAPGPKREANAVRTRRVVTSSGSGWVRTVGVPGARPPGEMREALASEREQGTPRGGDPGIGLGTRRGGSGGSASGRNARSPGERTRAGDAAGGDPGIGLGTRRGGSGGSAAGPKREANAVRTRRVATSSGSGWVRTVGAPGARPPGEMREALASEREQGTPRRAGDGNRTRTISLEG
jgi:hypothetical protein